MVLRDASASKKTLRKYWENFFRNYALFYMQGVGIFTDFTVQKTVDTWLHHKKDPFFRAKMVHIKHELQ